MQNLAAFTDSRSLDTLYSRRTAPAHQLFFRLQILYKLHGSKYNTLHGMQTLTGQHRVIDISNIALVVEDNSKPRRMSAKSKTHAWCTPDGEARLCWYLIMLVLSMMEKSRATRMMSTMSKRKQATQVSIRPYMNKSAF